MVGEVFRPDRYLLHAYWISPFRSNARRRARCLHLEVTDRSKVIRPEGIAHPRAESSADANMTTNAHKQQASKTVTTLSSFAQRLLLADVGETGNTMSNNTQAGYRRGICMLMCER